jgi:hypothetical protein
VPGGAPIGPPQCGPGKPKCTGRTYCDPQPLCSIGEDCDGVCLPQLLGRAAAVDVSFLSLSLSAFLGT